MSKDIQKTQEVVSEQKWFDPNLKLNHLANESSPYLLSHADNPVDWYPWGDEAIERARKEDKPIFLSVGYASCHWCHVMEHESFEDEAVAAFLNEHFIAIKIDREQRPDLDQIYMTFVQTFTKGGGGWPMSVFLTPDLKPFFGGTYFPKEDRYGRPGFLSLLRNLNDVYRTDREKVNSQADAMSRAVEQRLRPYAAKAELGKSIFDRAVKQSLSKVDPVHGGFGTGRKFPHTAELTAQLRSYASTGDESTRTTLEKTLRAMASRGMYDHIGGGFHRYVVDREWTAPHFEKMLYDNSLLVPVYLDAFLLLGDRDYKETALRALDFMLREMTDKEGGLYSALDADSEGEEGIFYIWKKSELDEILGSEAELFYQYYIATERGNFDGGTNVLALNLASFDELKNNPQEKRIRKSLAVLVKKLFDARAPRERPLTDDKVVTGWNGMALTAFCRGYQVSGEQNYLDAARKLGGFLKDKMYRDGVLLHSYRQGVFSTGKFLEDYGYVANGMVDLYETDHDYKWLEFSIKLVREGFELFSDPAGHLYISPAELGDQIVRPSDIYDGSYPSPGAYLLLAAQRLIGSTDDRKLQASLDHSLDALSGAISQYPVGLMSTLLVAYNQFVPRAEFAVVGPEADRAKFLEMIYQRYIPNRIIATSESADDRLALLKNRPAGEGGAAYVCQNFVCKLPASTPNELSAQIDELLDISNGAK
ncbi:MAG: thioredoxin domain-containing protein [candidate division Zixibacteria bacterium]|nr:thioredoxin domain-containing protein [candidate division Zixibacteria bacterium]